jgi:hypothetical protein
MSDNWIVFIPENPRVRPDVARQKKAESRFAELPPEADEITCTSSDEVRFFDCGGNFERIVCPSCGSEVAIEWWQDRMDEDFDNGFKLSQYALPCCHVKCSLHDLASEWPQGFGQFSLEAMNPNLGELKDEYRKEFEEILGTPLRVIYRHV